MLAEPTRSGLAPLWQPDRAERDAALREVRARGWALTDEQLALGIRSVAAPLRDGDRPGRSPRSTSTRMPRRRRWSGSSSEHLPLLLAAAGEISADFARLAAVPHETVAS